MVLHNVLHRLCDSSVTLDVFQANKVSKIVKYSMYFEHMCNLYFLIKICRSTNKDFLLRKERLFHINMSVSFLDWRILN